MPKNRFTSLDLRRAVLDLKVQDIVGMRLSNLYDLNRKTYLLKLVKPDHKVYVIIESGIRLHSTQYTRERNAIPSIFAMKLRKHIRTKRLESIEQYGMDRVFDMTFGSGEATYHLIVELYAAGNIVLTDKDYKILCLLRSYELADGTAVVVGGKYPVTSVRGVELPTVEKLTEVIKTGGEKAIKNVLSPLDGYEPAVIEHCILAAGGDPKAKASTFGPELVVPLQKEFQTMFEYMQSVKPHNGWIICKPSKNQPKLLEGEAPKPVEGVATVESSSLIYDQFIPFFFEQHKNDEHFIQYPSFNQATDEFFSKILVQKTEEKAFAHENTIERKLEKVRSDHDYRIKQLESQELKWNQYALLIEQNTEDVDACIANIRASLSYKVDWVQLEEDLKSARDDGNPFALMIHKLNLKDNKITVLLYDKYLDEAENDFDKPTSPVEIDIGITAFANARAYYEKRKLAKEKTDKTRAAADMAFKSATKKAQQTMKETKQVKSVTALRKQFWFEKFHWFITTDNYIVVGGRDVQQNEILYKRYLQKGDIYFHADLHGASSVIVKNASGQPLPPFTISQAGSFALCHSGAWKNKVVQPTFWVNDNQVSKTAPSGEYLSSGGFMIRGKKNFCNQNQLIMGFGIMFRVSDESLVNHIDERKPKLLDGDQQGNEKPQKGEAQPKHWEPKKKEPQQPKKQVEEESSESEDQELGKELRDSGMGVNLVRETDASRESNSDAPFTFGMAKPTVFNPKKRMTAKERRDAKKVEGDDVTESDEDESEDSDEEGNENQTAQQKSKVKGPQPQKLARGKKAKLKKAEKYAWQDEQDRKLAMEMLGYKVVSVSENDVKVNSTGKKGAEQEAKQAQTAAKEAINKERETKKIRKEKEEEELLQMLRDEKIELLSEDDRKKIEDLKAQGLGLNLASFTGKPHPNDILLFAIPVCGPYEIFKDYKFKVKIMPGGSKKGAAIKTCIHHFLTNCSASQAEKDLIKAIPEEDLQQAMITSPKLSGPGVQR